MKTKLFFAAAAVAVISLSSCKKDYICECEVDQQGSSAQIDLEYNDVKKDEAEDACSSAETTYSSGGADATCTLSEK